MRTIEWSGSITARSSIAHTGKESGTNHGFRRETLLLPGGQRVSAPVISGGVIRGSMRRMAAMMAQQAVVGDGGRLPFSTVHALRTGGALRETRAAEEVLTGERQAEVRDLIPMLSIFGFSTSGRIVSGRLEVDKAVPITRETVHLAEHYGLDPEPDTLPSLWDISQQEKYTRFADVLDAGAQPYIEVDPSQSREIPKGSGHMLWSQETLLAGTPLYHQVVLSQATPIEVSFMDELMRRWSARGRVGAQIARGMGRVEMSYTRSCLDVLGDPVPEEAEVDWRAVTEANRDRILEVLGWL